MAACMPRRSSNSGLAEPSTRSATHRFGPRLGQALFDRVVADEEVKLRARGVRLRFVGNLDLLPGARLTLGLGLTLNLTLSLSLTPNPNPNPNPHQSRCG